jgi:hypothetical protein
MQLSPKLWALATFLVPVASAVGYLGWLIFVDTPGLATSTRSEEIVRAAIYGAASIVFLLLRRPWARAVAIACAVALVLWLIGTLQFEVFRG